MKRAKLTIYITNIVIYTFLILLLTSCMKTVYYPPNLQNEKIALRIANQAYSECLRQRSTEACFLGVRFAEQIAKKSHKCCWSIMDEDAVLGNTGGIIYPAAQKCKKISSDPLSGELNACFAGVEFYVNFLRKSFIAE